MKKLARKPKIKVYCECLFSSLQGDSVTFYYGQDEYSKMRRYAEAKGEWWLLNKQEYMDENRTGTFIKIMKHFGKLYSIRTPF